MKVGILTYYGVHNHGAVLQANALKTIIESYGHDVSFLKFKRNYDYIPVENERKYNIGISSIPFYVRYLIERGAGNIIYNIKKNKSLSKYRKNHFKMGERYSDFSGDAVVIGSDEVFSFEIGINPFFFGHGINAKKVLSYAGSFGPTTFEDLESRNLCGIVKSGAEKMCAVGVRDNNSKSIIEELSNVEAILVCDPVILYGYEKEQYEFKPKEKDYIVVYAYDRNMNDEEDVKNIKAYAKKNGLKIFSVGYHHSWCDKSLVVSPEELLGYIKNAKLVITDTFHGSVLSIVCNANFVAKIRSNKNKLEFLLEQYSLNDRLISDFSNLEEMQTQSIDFDCVNKKTVELREKALSFLKSGLES